MGRPVDECIHVHATLSYWSSFTISKPLSSYQADSLVFQCPWVIEVFRKQPHFLQDYYQKGIRGVMLRRFLLQTIPSQFASISLGDILVSPNTQAATSTHPRNSDNGVMAVLDEERAIKSWKRPSVSWKHLNRDMVQSFICFLQLYSEKHRTSIEPDGLYFHRLQVSVLSFT